MTNPEFECGRGPSIHDVLAQRERDGQLALLRERNAQLLAENTKLQRLVNTQKLVIAGLQIQAVELLRERR